MPVEDALKLISGACSRFQCSELEHVALNVAMNVIAEEIRKLRHAVMSTNQPKE